MRLLEKTATTARRSAPTTAPCPACASRMNAIDHSGTAWWLCDTCSSMMART